MTSKSFSGSVAMSGERCNSDLEAKSHLIVLALMLVACAVAATLMFGLAFRPAVTMFTANTF
jgi:hypothetical protein